MTGNAARQIRMPHASGRVASAAIRKPGPAENRKQTVPPALATRVLAWATRCTAQTAPVVFSTAGAAVPANGAIVATWTANAVRGLTFAVG